jgi:hypothetical protein
MTACAFWGSFQSEGSSARAFSPARRFWAASMSKMPPQQPDGLLDLVDDVGDFGTHE